MFDRFSNIDRFRAMVAMLDYRGCLTLEEKFNEFVGLVSDTIDQRMAALENESNEQFEENMARFGR